MNKIRELRKKFNYTQTELAELCKTTTSNVSGWECGKWQPDNETLITLANTFNVTVDYLLGRETITKKEAAEGMGNYPTTLSAAEWEWLELRSLILEKHDEKYLQTLISMIKTLANK